MTKLTELNLIRLDKLINKCSCCKFRPFMYVNLYHHPCESCGLDSKKWQPADTEEKEAHD